MSRPLRVEFPGAWYHVTNRGAGHRNIFHNDSHRLLFMNLLSEISKMFQVETHAYCLMDNNYHLLLHTPKGNLQRAMRHLSGIYTQRYNRAEDTDGPLFRGRYKAILVEPNAYLLNVSRYIHLSPVVAGLTLSAEEYQWSSFRTYIGIEPRLEWLQTKFILDMVKNHQPQDCYQTFVKTGIDKETKLFYNKKKCPPVLGSNDFLKYIHAKAPIDREIPEAQRLKPVPSMKIIVRAVSVVFATPQKKILLVTRGRRKKNIARSAAIYCCRKLTGLPLTEIAEYFGLSHYGSVSGLVSKFEQLIKEDLEVKQLILNVEEIINKQI